MRITIVDPVQTGKNLKNLRKKAGISVRELQSLLGLAAPQAIYKWQTGEALPSVDHLVILAGVLEVPVDELLATKVV